MSQDIAERAVRLAQSLGAFYCDARFETIESESLVVENGSLEHNTSKYEEGVGVRVLCNGAWGFFSTSEHDKLEQGISNAIKSAKHNSTAKKSRVVLAESKAVQTKTSFPVKKEPTLEEIRKIVFDCDRIIRDDHRVSKDRISASTVKCSKYFVSSDGARIEQVTSDVVLELTAIAHGAGITQAVNTTEGGRGGLEIIDSIDIYSVSAEISNKASMLLDARAPMEEKSTIIMNPDFVALLTHEILGHPSEADRVLGKEMAWAGGAWWAGMLGQKIGSDQLSVIDDPTIPRSLGWYDFDDEGIRSQRKQILKEGVLVNHMHSRETASIFNVEPNASMRAASYSFMPLIRMACTCIEKGDWDPQEMIKDVKHGYLVSNMKVPSIDMKRYSWSISCQYANRIENGEVGELLRDVIVVGIAPEFFRSIDACGKDFTVRPITNCGKGDPMQQMRMGNGGPSIRGVATIKSA